ncbi:hypothetical protein EJ07DRAFT_103324 [Lizonia empirigonia]|nr:hypothetical protein EJ07DRAFT_103324 [Lizonia empirigonia]
MSTSRALTVACSCGSATHTFTTPISHLPLASHLCSCDTSRRISGSLLTSYINITHDKSAPKPDLSGLTPYRSSDKLTRYFCSTCGTHIPAKTPVYAHCHCNGVKFWISPPNAASETARSDYADLIIPYHLGQDASTSTPWWLCDEGTRFLAGTCACLSCRRASGFDITFWAFIPTANIFSDSNLTQPFPTDSVGHLDEHLSTLKTYSSSEGVRRTFCGKCGANVFWDGGKERGRFGLVDVAVGLLAADTGARAEELLAWWTKRVSFEEFAVNKSLVRTLGEGLKDWGKRKGSTGAAGTD